MKHPAPSQTTDALIGEEEQNGKQEKGIEAQRVKYPTPSQTTDALIGEEEQNGKPEKGIEAQGGNTQPQPRQLMS